MEIERLIIGARTIHLHLHARAGAPLVGQTSTGGDHAAGDADHRGEDGGVP
jgi:hypothetical protein